MEISLHDCILIKQETDCSLFEGEDEGGAFGLDLLAIFAYFGCIFGCIEVF
jgi:hypothetical protein